MKTLKCLKNLHVNCTGTTNETCLLQVVFSYTWATRDKTNWARDL